MVLERDRIDNFDGTRSRREAEEHTVDCLMGVFEGVNDEFGVREVGDLKV
jgi:hypothetical protein